MTAKLTNISESARCTAASVATKDGSTLTRPELRLTTSAPGATVQKEEPAPSGRMIPLTTSTWPAAVNRDPTCRPKLAAVAVVTATSNAADDPCLRARVGREPATSVALLLRPLRYRISSWGGPSCPADGPAVPETTPAVMARPDHCDAAGASGRPSRLRPPASCRPANASFLALR